MKLIKHIIIFLAISFFLSCNDSDYLLRTPESNITEPSFWKTPNDLKIFANQFYTTLPDIGGYDQGLYGHDGRSDNMIYENYDIRLAGLTTIPNTGSVLNYSNIRSVNYFLEKGSQLDILDIEKEQANAYLGEGYFFRAWYYFNLLLNYGGVPWIDKVLTTSSPELYSSREDRSLTADRILNDLDVAIEYLKPANSAEPNRLNKEIALALKSRVALFEGTWEKYHSGTSFGASNANPEKYLQIAVEASKDIIDGKYGKIYTIYSTGNPNQDYFNLFNQDDLSTNDEIIFWKKYDYELGTGHNLQRYTGITYPHPTKSLIDSYLCVNGHPISNSNGLYQGDDLPFDIYENRDPRLRQITFVKGDPRTIEGNDTLVTFEKGTIHLSGNLRSPTGFNFKKGLTPNNNSGCQQVDFTSNTALIYFRYAEILLNYVEAKAELGTLTQSDVDLTINKIRDRVNMAHLNISNIVNDPNWDFPELSPVMNEIRRERRNELACEGFRLNDILRWRAHHLISGQKPLGIKFDQSMYPELTPGVNIHLSSDGYVDPYAISLPNGWGFKPDRDYLLPLSKEELTLNPNLVQNPGWN